jgi:type VI secretion system secreted protein Hcp
MPIFLKIDGVDGDVTDEQFEGWFDVLSFNFGCEHSSPPGVGGGGRRAGRTQLSPLTVMKIADKATPTLFQACANGRHFRGAVLVALKDDSGRSDQFLKVTMTDILISSYSASGNAGGDPVPVESMSLNFLKIELAFQGGGGKT